MKLLQYIIGMIIVLGGLFFLGLIYPTLFVVYIIIIGLIILGKM